MDHKNTTIQSHRTIENRLLSHVCIYCMQVPCVPSPLHHPWKVVVLVYDSLYLHFLASALHIRVRRIPGSLLIRLTHGTLTERTIRQGGVSCTPSSSVKTFCLRSRSRDQLCVWVDADNICIEFGCKQILGYSCHLSASISLSTSWKIRVW